LGGALLNGNFASIFVLSCHLLGLKKKLSVFNVFVSNLKNDINSQQDILLLSGRKRFSSQYTHVPYTNK